MTMEIGTRIRQLRETKGFSQQVVADHLDITQNTITKLKVIISKGYCMNTTSATQTSAPLPLPQFPKFLL